MPPECVVCSGILTGRQRKYCSSKCSKRASRAAWIKKVYGISLEEWDAILEFQGGVCGVCGRQPRKDEMFHLDHEHTTGGSGRLRGILDGYCNSRVVGRLTSEKAAKLAAYLIDPPAPKALGREVIAPGRPKKPRQPRKRRR